jgi:uncharacterized membrane protein SirB2
VYDALHWLHAGLAVLSGSGFVVRGVWRLMGSALADLGAVRKLPHVVDALLLLAGVALAVSSQRWPHEHPWLLAKLAALLAYVGLGLVALRFGRTQPVRALAYVGALGCFGYMLAVAATRQVLPWAVAIP